MKELKIRLWDIDNKKMIYIYPLHDFLFRKKAFNKKRFKSPKNYIEMRSFYKKDINGKDIYDGDIVKYCIKSDIKRLKSFGIEKEGTGHFKWDEEYRMYCLIIGDKGIEEYIKAAYEVVGNIYEEHLYLKGHKNNNHEINKWRNDYQ